MRFLIIILGICFFKTAFANDSTSFTIDTLFVGASGGTFHVQVKSTVSWLTGTGGEQWISVTPLSGIGNDSIRIQISANQTTKRIGSVTLVSSMGNPQLVIVQEVPNGLYETQLNQLFFYPNPVKHLLHFSEEIQIAEIFNIDGVLVKKCSKFNIIDCGELASGLYFIYTERGFTKFIKE
ncbi:MAG: hypothetical protein MUC81_01540 [Bacteroidia bacterium]|jgi:hypothetical protein|nr:hypothetical protein [Bacteroidia bacterium]